MSSTAKWLSIWLSLPLSIWLSVVVNGCQYVVNMSCKRLQLSCQAVVNICQQLSVFNLFVAWLFRLPEFVVTTGNLGNASKKTDEKRTWHSCWKCRTNTKSRPWETILGFYFPISFSDLHSALYSPIRRLFSVSPWPTPSGRVSVQRFWKSVIDLMWLQTLISS